MIMRLAKAKGAQQDYGMRVYDGRLGRFLSVDPITQKYPELTPYQFASNRPIEGVDIDGMEVGYWDKNLNYYSMPSDAIRHPIPKGTNLPSIRALEGGKAQSIMMSSSYIIAGATLAVVATPYIAAAIGTAGSWAMGAGLTIASNPQAIQAAGEFLTGMVYDGPGDLFPGSGVDNAGKTTGQGIKKLPRIVSELFSNRRSLANAFYRAAGFTDDLVRASHIKGIDMGKAVETVTLKAGTEINQWVNVERGVGNYFTIVDNVSENLGIGDYAQRVLKTFKLKIDVKVLKSTAAEFDGNAGGGTQFFSTELKNAVEEVIKN